MLEALNQDYITTARAKGVSNQNVINKHARPNALIPMATMAGMTIAGLLGGVTITETIFNFPGIGSAGASAAVQLDVITVLSFVLLTGIILLFSNLIVDIAYAFPGSARTAFVRRINYGRTICFRLKSQRPDRRIYRAPGGEA